MQANEREQTQSPFPAGSGKTFALAKEYIRLLLQSGDPYAYRQKVVSRGRFY